MLFPAASGDWLLPGLQAPEMSMVTHQCPEMSRNFCLLALRDDCLANPEFLSNVDFACTNSAEYPNKLSLFFFFWPGCPAYRILVPQPGIETRALSSESTES